MDGRDKPGHDVGREARNPSPPLQPFSDGSYEDDSAREHGRARAPGGESMIRFVLRFIGMWLLAGGFVALVLDGVRSIASSEIVLSPLDVTWFATSEESFAQFQTFVETRLPTGTWETVMVPLMQAPLAAVLGVLGLILMLIGRR